MVGSGGRTQKSNAVLRLNPVRLALISVLGLSLSACTSLSTDPAKLPESQDFVAWMPRSYSNTPFPAIQSKASSPVADPKSQVKESDRLPRPTQTWWLEFGSEELGDLVETALANNYDLRVAVARIEQAERQALIANSARYPEINFFVTRGMEGPAGGLGTATSRDTYQHKNEYSFGFRASYEVDLWGKIGYQADAALAQARASVFNRQAVALTLASEVTTAYLQILSLNERLDISEKNIEIANQVADALLKRVEQGDSTVIDLQRQQVTIALLQNVQANLKLQRERLINRLAVLLGRPPSTVKIQSKDLSGVKIPRVTPGLPSELLCRRPDIRRAEAQLAAASADVNAARANLLPSMTLTGSFGQGSQQLSDLLKPQSLLYNAAANLIQNIFDAGKRENQLASARARNRELLDTYANTVLAALRDVEDALAGIRLTEMQQTALAEVLSRNNRLLDLSRTIFDRGALEYIAFLDTQRDVFQAQDSEANARFEQARAAVDLFKALGGGLAPENDPCVSDPKADLLVDPKAGRSATQSKPVEPKLSTPVTTDAKPDESAVKAKADAEKRLKAEQEAAAKARAEEQARIAAQAKAKIQADEEARRAAELNATRRTTIAEQANLPRSEPQAAPSFRVNSEFEASRNMGLSTTGTPSTGQPNAAPLLLETLLVPSANALSDQPSVIVPNESSPAGKSDLPPGAISFPVN